MLKASHFFPYQVFSLCALLLILPNGAFSQTTAPIAARDPNAVALANQALQALTGGTTLTDITLQASAIYTAGSAQETGPATLIALGNQQSSVTLNLTNGQRQEMRNGAAGVWIGAGGTARAMAKHNCHLDADWFFPALSLQALATDPTLGITLLGQETHNGQQVYHLSLFHTLSGPPPDVVARIQQLSAMDLYLDDTSLLPAALDFNTHPENSVSLNIAIEIRFSAYQSFNGVQVPTHIQKFLQNALYLDITATNAAVNSGVAASLFTLPQVQPAVPGNSGTSAGGGQ